MFRPFRLAVLMAGFAFAVAASAQQAPPDYDAGYADAPPGAPDAADVVDPPQRVARLSLIRGAVSFVPAGENDWVEAQLNRPLVTGDKLWTDSGSRTELQLGAAAIRANEQTSINFLNLDDQNAQVEMTQGILNLRVRRLYDGQTYEIDTPTLAFVINRVGEYRVDVAPDGHGAIVTVFHGSGDAYGEGGARFRVEEGQSVRFNDAQLRDYASNNLPPPDDFDRFCLSRDSSWDGSPSRQYVAEDVIGYEDLDNNGSWSDEPEYGNVWYPSNVAVGWTPYSYGSWGWVGAYGWTWVDSSPWGFAPFHYGRWAYVHNRWGWCPGSVHVRPYYAPALVAFIGNGNARVGFSTGAPVGWFPLGPRDVYVPGYRVSHNYFTRVNVYAGINSVQINNYYGNYSRGNFDYAHVNYANRNIAGAVTAVPGNVFTGARQIRGSALPVTRETFVNGHVSGFAAVAPTRQSLGFGGARAVGAPRVATGRNVIAATRPPAPIAPFAQREAMLQREPGRALPARELRSVSVQGGAQNGGAQSMHESANAHANVNVVTSSGRPARLPAQAVAPRGPVQQGQQSTPGFPSADRDTRMRAPGDTRTIDSQTRSNQPASTALPTQNAVQSQQIQRGRVEGQESGYRGPRENVSHENVDATPQQYRSTTVEHVPKTGAQDYRPGTVDRGTQFQQPVQQQTQTQQQSQQIDPRSGREYHRAQQPSSTQQQPQQELQQHSREVQSPQYRQLQPQPQPKPDAHPAPQPQQVQQQQIQRGQPQGQPPHEEKKRDSNQQQGRKPHDEDKSGGNRP